MCSAKRQKLLAFLLGLSALWTLPARSSDIPHKLRFKASALFSTYREIFLSLRKGLPTFAAHESPAFMEAVQKLLNSEVALPAQPFPGDEKKHPWVYLGEYNEENSYDGKLAQRSHVFRRATTLAAIDLPEPKTPESYSALAMNFIRDERVSVRRLEKRMNFVKTIPIFWTATIPMEVPLNLTIELMAFNAELRELAQKSRSNEVRKFFQNAQSHLGILQGVLFNGA